MCYILILLSLKTRVITSRVQIEYLIFDYGFYLFQSKAPSRHSWITPTNKINKNTSPKSVQVVNSLKEPETITGRRRAISTSKTKKITATKKNRREKANRPLPTGSKPHSKGEFFSRSLSAFLPKTIETPTSNPLTANKIRLVNESGTTTFT